MNFQNEKKQALEKIMSNDKSKKGSIDKAILNLINLINENPDFYTTSSCAGRIMLFKPSKTGKKYEAEWLYSSHEPVKLGEIKPFLEKLPEETVWLRMEPPIIHICARTLERADSLLKTANDAGFRRSCILSLKRIIVEINIPEKMDVPVAQNKKILVDDSYLELLVDKANIRLEKSRKKIRTLEKLFFSGPQKF